MTSAILLKSHLVVDLFLWQILLGIAGVVVIFGVVYLVRVHIALRMAKNRHRDRYNYGILYRGEDGEVYIKRNLKIRFKKS